MNRFAPFFVIFAASLWGIDGILLRPYLYTLPVPLVVFLESLIIVLVILIFFLRSFESINKLHLHDWLAFAGVAIMGGVVGTMAITKALFFVNFVNLSIVVLIQKLQPAFAILLAALFLKEKPPKTFYIWALLAMAGAYIMTFGINKPVLNAHDKTALAAFFALIATVSFASSTVLSKRALKNVEFKEATYIRFILTALIMFIVVLFNGNLSDVKDVSESQWLIFVAIAFLTGGPGIFLYYYGLKHIKASVATIAELAFPLTAVILEYLVRGNIIGPVQWVGVVILFYSILRVSRLNKKV